MFHVCDCNHSFTMDANHSYIKKCNDSYAMTNTLADTIKKIRLRAGDSPAKAAAKIGVSRPGYLKWEQGDTQNMKLGNLLAFCDHYEIAIERLIRGLITDEEIEGSPVNPPGADKYEQSYQSTRLIAAERDPDAKMLIDGYSVADDGLKRAMLTLARESLTLFELRNEKNN